MKEERSNKKEKKLKTQGSLSLAPIVANYRVVRKAGGIALKKINVVLLKKKNRLN